MNEMTNETVTSKYPSMFVTLFDIVIEVWYSAADDLQSVVIMEMKPFNPNISKKDWDWIVSEPKNIETIETEILWELISEEDFDDIGD